MAMCGEAGIDRLFLFFFLRGSEFVTSTLREEQFCLVDTGWGEMGSSVTHAAACLFSAARQLDKSHRGYAGRALERGPARAGGMSGRCGRVRAGAGGRCGRVARARA